MEIVNSIGSFDCSDGKAVLVRCFDDEESLAYSRRYALNPSLNCFNDALLKELRWPQYREKLIHANILLVKSQIAESVNTDNHIIQAINAVGELDKVCNTLVKRVREWYGYYYPELSHAIPDNEMFIKRILQKSKEEFMLERGDVVSMGPSIDKVYLDTMLAFARQVDDLYLQRAEIINFIDNTMMAYCPNMYTITGALVGAKLIEKAKSLKHLAFLPSSTIQLLGAEKALFRHLRNRKVRPPKHGLILSHPFVMNARRSNKGRAARMFAAKISIAAKVDYFKGEFIGDQLKEDMDKKAKG